MHDWRELAIDTAKWTAPLYVLRYRTRNLVVSSHVKTVVLTRLTTPLNNPRGFIPMDCQI